MRLYLSIFFFLLVKASNGNVICPKSGVTSSIGGCYFIIPYNETFGKAEHFCGDFYGNLASIANAFDNSQLLQMAWQNLDGADNFWLGATFDGVNVTWLDGSPDMYRNFGPGTEVGNVVMNLKSGKWLTATWNAQLPFACIDRQVGTTISPTLPQCPQFPPCPTEWTYFDSVKGCYKVLYDVDFTNADEQCRSMGSNLTSIHSTEENRIVNQMLKLGHPIQTADYDDIAMIGGRRTGPGLGDFSWVDGSPWDYTNWADGEPSNKQNKEHCLGVFADLWPRSQHPDQDLHKWDDIDCTVTYRVALCKQAAKY